MASIRFAETALKLLQDGKTVDDFVRICNEFLDGQKFSYQDDVFLIDTIFDTIFTHHTDGINAVLEDPDRVIEVLDRIHKDIISHKSILGHNIIYYGYKTTQKSEYGHLNDERITEFVLKCMSHDYYPIDVLTNYSLDPSIKEFMIL
jgi:hypothetical protein